MLRIAPSLMCANLLELGKQVRELESAGATLFHIDVIDGHFVPNLGLNFDLVSQLQKVTPAALDLHLMVDKPERYVEILQRLRLQYVSFHIEATHTPLRLARALQATGARTGIALNPCTPAEAVYHVLDGFDYVLVMTVEPGFAGQQFLPAMYEKIRTLRTALDRIRPGIDIEVDGNLSIETSRRCIQCGATMLVGGTSSVFLRDHNIRSAYQEFHDALTAAPSQSSRRSRTQCTVNDLD